MTCFAFGAKEFFNRKEYRYLFHKPVSMQLEMKWGTTLFTMKIRSSAFLVGQFLMDLKFELRYFISF
jgi:hypothetical protein